MHWIIIVILIFSLYFFLGKGAGSLVGGYMYHHFGARKTFRLFSIANMFSAIAFFIFHLMYIRRRQRRLSQYNLANPDLGKDTEMSRLNDDGNELPTVNGYVICANCNEECEDPPVVKFNKGTQTEEKKRRSFMIRKKSSQKEITPSVGATIEARPRETS